MSTTHTTEYLIQELPEPPPRRPWWLIPIKMGVVTTLVIVVALIGYNLAESLGERAASADVAPTIAVGIPVDFVIPPGATANDVAALLEAQGVVISADDFRTAVREAGAAARLKAGTYQVVTGASFNSLIGQFVSGPPAPETYRVTVIEGLRIEEMLAALADPSPHEIADFEAVLLDGTVTSPLLPEPRADLPPLARWEGLLAPDTYEFAEDAPPELILQRLADTLAARMQAIDWTGLEPLGLEPYDGLIVASLIEREAKLEEERPLISSVIYNRIEIDQMLEIDATIIYALGRNPGEVTLNDLQVNSPYNTYRNLGLPPTPIAGVRITSLEAAASPAETSFFYYVLINEDGTHGFSETFEQHQALVEQAKADGVLTP
jgi:UPF0755 protein